MKAKLFEIRDAATFIPVLAVQFGSDNDAERYLASRAGYGRSPEEQRDYVWLAMIDGNESRNGTYDPCKWPGGARTMATAHRYIIEHFDELETGAIIDVEFILGITSAPTESERLTAIV